MTASKMNRLRIVCAHCEEVNDVRVPTVGEDMNPSALEGFGRCVIEAQLLHGIFECAALSEERR